VPATEGTSFDTAPLLVTVAVACAWIPPARSGGPIVTVVVLS